MSYCTAAEVTGDFKGLTVSGSTPLTTTVLERWIDEASAEIDARIQNKYTVPVTGTEALKVIKSICVAIVSARVRAFTQVKSEASETTTQSKGGNEMLSPWKKLDMIAKGDMVLSDAVVASSEDGVSSYSSVDDTDVEHTFEMGEDQW